MDITQYRIPTEMRILFVFFWGGFNHPICFRRSRSEKTQDIQNGSYDLLEKIIGWWFGT